MVSAAAAGKILEEENDGKMVLVPGVLGPDPGLARLIYDGKK